MNNTYYRYKRLQKIFNIFKFGNNAQRKVSIYNKNPLWKSIVG